MQGSLNSIVLWTPLADVGRDDYPVIVADGSHLLGLLPSTEHVFGHQIEPARVQGLDFHPVELKRGDILVFSTLLAHATSDTGGDRVRTAASFRFNDAADSSYIERGLPIPLYLQGGHGASHTGFSNSCRYECNVRLLKVSMFSSQSSLLDLWKIILNDLRP